MAQKARNPPLLPTHTFVVQLRSDTQVETGQVAGRVEHLISRHAMMFESLDTLLAFIARMLQEVRTTSTGQEPPHPLAPHE
jgi:hypothetical protein